MTEKAGTAFGGGPTYRGGSSPTSSSGKSSGSVSTPSPPKSVNKIITYDGSMNITPNIPTKQVSANLPAPVHSSQAVATGKYTTSGQPIYAPAYQVYNQGPLPSASITVKDNVGNMQTLTRSPYAGNVQDVDAKGNPVGNPYRMEDGRKVPVSFNIPQPSPPITTPKVGNQPSKSGYTDAQITQLIKNTGNEGKIEAADIRNNPNAVNELIKKNYGYYTSKDEVYRNLIATGQISTAQDSTMLAAIKANPSAVKQLSRMAGGYYQSRVDYYNDVIGLLNENQKKMTAENLMAQLKSGKPVPITSLNYGPIQPQISTLGDATNLKVYASIDPDTGRGSYKVPMENRQLELPPVTTTTTTKNQDKSIMGQVGSFFGGMEENYEKWNQLYTSQKAFNINYSVPYQAARGIKYLGGELNLGYQNIMQPILTARQKVSDNSISAGLIDYGLNQMQSLKNFNEVSTNVLAGGLNYAAEKPFILAVRVGQGFVIGESLILGTTALAAGEAANLGLTLGTGFNIANKALDIGKALMVGYGITQEAVKLASIKDPVERETTAGGDITQLGAMALGYGAAESLSAKFSARTPAQFITKKVAAYNAMDANKPFYAYKSIDKQLQEYSNIQLTTRDIMHPTESLSEPQYHYEMNKAEIKPVDVQVQEGNYFNQVNKYDIDSLPFKVPNEPDLSISRVFPNTQEYIKTGVQNALYADYTINQVVPDYIRGENINPNALESQFLSFFEGDTKGILSQKFNYGKTSYDLLSFKFSDDSSLLQIYQNTGAARNLLKEMKFNAPSPEIKMREQIDIPDSGKQIYSLTNRPPSNDIIEADRAFKTVMKSQVPEYTYEVKEAKLFSRGVSEADNYGNQAIVMNTNLYKVTAEAATRQIASTAKLEYNAGEWGKVFGDKSDIITEPNVVPKEIEFQQTEYEFASEPDFLKQKTTYMKNGEIMQEQPAIANVNIKNELSSRGFLFYGKEPRLIERPITPTEFIEAVYPEETASAIKLKMSMGETETNYMRIMANQDFLNDNSGLRSSLKQKYGVLYDERMINELKSINAEVADNLNNMGGQQQTMLQQPQTIKSTIQQLSLKLPELTYQPKINLALNQFKLNVRSIPVLKINLETKSQQSIITQIKSQLVQQQYSKIQQKNILAQNLRLDLTQQNVQKQVQQNIQKQVQQNVQKNIQQNVQQNIQQQIQQQQQIQVQQQIQQNIQQQQQIQQQIQMPPIIPVPTGGGGMLWDMGGEQPRPRKKPKHRKNMVGYIPDFTAKQLGISTRINKRQLKKLLNAEFTGLEISRPQVMFQ